MAKARKKLTHAQALDLLGEIRADVEADEELAKRALDIVNNYYWGTVRATAAEFLERAKKGEFEDDESLRDSLHQEIDGNYWVIYTYWARVCRLMTNNADAYEEEMGEPPKDDSQAAYFAMMADVSNHPDMEEAMAIARGEDE